MRTILSLRSDLAFLPKDVKVMAKAFDNALVLLRERGRTEHARETVARLIIEEATRGERDPDRLCQTALQGFYKQ
jgi:hypothetical protein